MVDALVRITFVAPHVWIGVDALGTRFEMERNGRKISLTLPSAADTFSALAKESKEPVRFSLVQAGPTFLETGVDNRAASLVLFQITVETEVEFPVVKPLHPTDEQRHTVEAVLSDGIRVATDVAGSFLRHLRAAAPAQSWLGLSAHPPQQYGLAELEYRKTGQRIFAIGPLETQILRSPRLILNRKDIEEIGRNIMEHREPDVADSLLADAWHLEDAMAANDQDRALLVAAVACEVRTKQVIRERSPESHRPIVDLLLQRRSNLPELLDEILEACCGVNLRKSDPNLFSSIKRLAQQRNSVVHTGIPSSEGERVVLPSGLASQLFRWLDANVLVTSK